jgi:hypothetical protein
MNRVGFEPIIPVFERAKIFHTLHCAAAVNKCMHKKKYSKRKANNPIEVICFQLIQTDNFKDF